MITNKGTRRYMHCSFCGKHRTEVRDLVGAAADLGVRICDECVEEARRIMTENAGKAGAKPALVPK